MSNSRNYNFFRIQIRLDVHEGYANEAVNGLQVINQFKIRRTKISFENFTAVVYTILY